jgi:hypothetical protein
VKARPGDDERPYALLQRIVLAHRSLASTVPLADEHRAWLARVVPTLGPAMAGAESPTRMAHALAAALHAADVRQLLLDDLHCADAATLELLPLLSASEPPLCVLLTARRGEWPLALAD